ncbi:hypothetical protein IW262DRAFT_368644 [Armillaria fumosa]|nr:hypothetical protein IW262DRAFT_368644 [Armillaria fumosa]
MAREMFPLLLHSHQLPLKPCNLCIGTGGLVIPLHFDKGQHKPYFTYKVDGASTPSIVTLGLDEIRSACQPRCTRFVISVAKQTIFDAFQRDLSSEKNSFRSSKNTTFEHARGIRQDRRLSWQQKRQDEQKEKVNLSFYRLLVKHGTVELSSLIRSRTSHAVLNAHLFRINAATSPNCDTCGVPETVSHFLLSCRRFADERQILRRRTRIGNLQLRNLLAISSSNIFATLSFVRRTGRSTAQELTWNPPP